MKQYYGLRKLEYNLKQMWEKKYLSRYLGLSLLSCVLACQPVPEPALSLAHLEQTPEPVAVYHQHVATAQSSDLWWLGAQGSRFQQAWLYGAGFDRHRGRPARIAVIDMGFAGLWEALQADGPLAGQVDYTAGRWIAVTHRPTGMAPLNQAWTANLLAAEDRDNLLPNGEILNLAKPHGTQALSLLVSRLNSGHGMSGVAPQARAIPFKAGNGFKVSWEEITLTLETILAMAEPVDVISMSLWGGIPEEFAQTWGPEHSGYAVSPRLQQVLQHLEQQGILVVVAAGNGGWNVARNFPGGLEDAAGVAVFPELITVGALQRDGQRAVFLPETPQRRAYASNWGPGVTIWAPGHEMLAIAARAGAFWDNEHTVHRGGLNAANLLPWSGSSAAAPLVAGALALLKSTRPELSAAQLRQALLQSSQTQQLQDSRLRTYPFLDPEAIPGECGRFTESYHCGQLFSGPLQFSVLQADTLLQQTAATPAHSLRGKLLPDWSLRTANAQTWQLRLGAKTDLSGYFARHQGAWLPLSQAVHQDVWVRGWPDPATGSLYVLSIEGAI